MPKQADRSRDRATPDPTLRVGDAERNDVAEALSQHYSAGRLDDTELKERLDAAMRAKTGADLVGLVSDLPPIGAPSPHPVPESPRRRRRGLWIVLGAVLVVALLAHGPFWWPWWSGVRFFWLIVAVVLFVLWRRARRHRGHEESSR